MLAIIDGDLLLTMLAVKANTMEKSHITTMCNKYVHKILQYIKTNSYYILLSNKPAVIYSQITLPHLEFIKSILLKGGYLKNNTKVHWGAVEVNDVENAMYTLYKRFYTTNIDKHFVSLGITSTMALHKNCPLLLHNNNKLKQLNGVHCTPTSFVNLLDIKYIDKQQAENNLTALLLDKNKVTGYSKITSNISIKYTNFTDSVLNVLTEYVISYGEVEGLQRFYKRYLSIKLHTDYINAAAIKYRM